MRSTDPQLAEVLKTAGLQRRWVADLYYGTERRASDIEMVDPQLQGGADNQIQWRGSVTVVWQGVFADSIAPRWVGSDYAPFGATLNVREVIQIGAARWEIPLGWYSIVDVPSAFDQKMMWNGRRITVGSQVELTLMDRMVELEQDEFDTPTAPQSLTSAIDEVARLTGFQILRTVPDARISKSVVYEENRLDALYELCDVVLDAVPYMTTDGALAFIPNTWGKPVAELVYGPGGTVQSIGNGMSAEGVKNYGVVRGSGTDVAPLLYRRWITEGPLRVYDRPGVFAPARARKFALSSQYVTTPAQAKPWLDRELEARSRLQAQHVDIVTAYDPRFELWDVLRIRDAYEDTSKLCRITGLSLRPGTADMTIQVEVAA